MHCLTGISTNVHDLGLFPVSAQVLVRFQSNFDPVAATILLRVGADWPNTTDPTTTRVPNASSIDDGRNLEPLLNLRGPWEAGASTCS